VAKIKRKLIRKSSAKPVALDSPRGMIGGLEVGRAPDESLRRAYIEQIKRDMAVLREDPIYWGPPGRRFYEERIKSFRKELLSKFPPVGAPAGYPAITRPTPKVWVRLRRKKVSHGG